jgi:hypothetical protein
MTVLQAPLIMMSQNRQAARDRLEAQHDYEVNTKAELEIVGLHAKLDEIRDGKWVELMKAQEQQLALLTQLAERQHAAEPAGSAPPTMTELVVVDSARPPPGLQGAQVAAEDRFHGWDVDLNDAVAVYLDHGGCRAWITHRRGADPATAWRLHPDRSRFSDERRASGALAAAPAIDAETWVGIAAFHLTSRSVWERRFNRATQLSSRFDPLDLQP